MIIVFLIKGCGGEMPLGVYNLDRALPRHGMEMPGFPRYWPFADGNPSVPMEPLMQSLRDYLL